MSNIELEVKVLNVDSKEIVIASGNEDKIKEVQEILKEFKNCVY